MYNLIEDAAFSFTFSPNRDGVLEYHEPQVERFIFENQGYVKKENAKDEIIHRRKSFEKVLLKQKGPTIIPTIFVNHPKRHEFLKEEDRARNRHSPPRPTSPVCTFKFANEVCLNLACNLALDEFSAFIKHSAKAKVVYLNKESCAELAFEELLSYRPLFYSNDENVLKNSSYADPVLKNWLPLRTTCILSDRYICEFSIIYPKGEVSSVMIICTDCGQLVESVLSPNTLQNAKKDIWQNIANLKCSQTDPMTRSVINLPIRMCNVSKCVFIQGLIGVTPLINVNPIVPSVFVRIRLILTCTPRNIFSTVIHHHEAESGLLDISEMMKSFEIV